LDKVDQKVAYYCRMHAVEQVSRGRLRFTAQRLFIVSGMCDSTATSLFTPRTIWQAMSIPKRAKEVTALLGAAIGKLEKDKQLLTLDPNIDKVHCEAFALQVFTKADRADRAGRRDAGTAKAFYAASCFLDVRARCAWGIPCLLINKAQAAFQWILPGSGHSQLFPPLAKQQAPVAIM
jgi:hypothetical protein